MPITGSPHVSKDDPSLTEWQLLEENLTNLYEAAAKLKDLSYYNLKHHAEQVHERMETGVIPNEEGQEFQELRAFVKGLVSDKSSKVKFPDLPRPCLFYLRQ